MSRCFACHLTTLLAAQPENPEPDAVVAESRPVVAQQPEAPAAAAASTDRSEPQRLVYRVKRGDTLFSIARLYNTTVESLKAWNSRIIGNRIKIGDRLTIFAARDAN